MDQLAPKTRLDATLLEPSRHALPPWRSRRPLLLLAAVLLVPALILGAACRSAWHAAWAEADRELAVSAEAAREFALRVVEGQARLSARVADAIAGLDDAALQQREPVLRDRIARMISGIPLVRAVIVTGEADDVLLMAAPSGEPPVPVPSLPRDELVAIGTHLSMSPAFAPASGRAPLVMLAQERLAAPGMVVVLLDANRLGTGLGRARADAADSAALIRTDGQIIARQPPMPAPAPRLGPSQPLVAAFAAGLTEGRVDGVTPRDGHPVLVRFAVLGSHPSLAVAVERPRAAIIDRWWRAATPLLLIGVPAILALGAFGWVVRRQQFALEDTLAGLEERVAERTASVREGEERLRMAIDAGRFGTWETNLKTGQTTRSARTVEILALDPNQTTSPFEDWVARIHPADRGRVLEAWNRAATGRGTGYREEYRYTGADGRWRWLESSGAVVGVEPLTGMPERISGMVRDITARREADERRQILMQEVNHRARNSLAIVQAILRLSRAEDAATYARVVEGRVAALARAQSLLAAERWTGAPLQAVIAEELAPYGGMQPAKGDISPRFVLTGGPVRLRAQAVQPLSIVFHELATNAAKHGALSAPEGRVAVSWHVDEHAGLLSIRWVESGGPVPGLPSRRGVGSRVMEATIAGQLAGSLDRRWPDGGLVCEIRVPLSRVRAGPT
ncbi:PAS domain-containing protein [Roseomonas sp. JC162]|uniref:histidine kinase n=1 Tax=Neoroseomonas marina TaxID=1232220 RepID=A0A848E9Q8_9PROT|nr:HWE histidine kinase domain-containing protein [Neoroseomonas marina]NMJ40203.1 PAS domain-containing protein [Neoroseomonas marina]